jgi:hypothetical protein
MRDWSAEGAFLLRPLDIDMNPLVIAGAGGKRVDAWLVYLDPIRKPELLPNSFAQTRKCEVTHVLPRSFATGSNSQPNVIVFARAASSLQIIRSPWPRLWRLIGLARMLENSLRGIDLSGRRVYGFALH